MSAAPLTTAFTYMFGGLIIWSVRFIAAYAFTAISCSRGWAEPGATGLGLIQLGLTALTAVAIAGCALILAYATVRLWNGVPRPVPEEGWDPAEEHGPGSAIENARFMHWIAATVAAISVLAMTFETVPAYIVPICLK